MKRRDFLLATAMFVPSLRYAKAQQPTKKKRIAAASASTKVEDMRRELGQTWDNELKRVGLIEGEKRHHRSLFCGGTS